MEHPRRTRPCDAPILAAIERDAAQAPWSHSRLARWLDRPSTLAYHFGHPAKGFVLSSIAGQQGEVLAITVRRSHHRHGVGRALMHALHENWLARGLSSGWLEVRQDNRAAIGLYRACGWLEDGRRPRYYSDDCDALVMKWRGCGS